MRLGSISILLLSIASLASAGPIVIDAGWYGFCFGEAGSPATAGCQNAGIGESGNPFTFSASGPVFLQVTDAFVSGDSFDIWVDGSLGLTTPSVASGTSGFENPDEAYASPLFSHGSLLLDAGAHSVEVFAHDSPMGSGGAYLQVISDSVPEPATILLLGLGLAAIVVLRRRRA